LPEKFQTQLGAMEIEGASCGDPEDFPPQISHGETQGFLERQMSPKYGKWWEDVVSHTNPCMVYIYINIYLDLP